MFKGYWMPVLHMHLPFVKHPEFDYFLEEHWLFEAINESYIPILMKMKSLYDDNIDFRITFSITPPLSEMLKDRLLMHKYSEHLDKQIELTEKETKRLKDDRQFADLAQFYHYRFLDIKNFFNSFLKGNVLNGFKYFQEKGKIEIITCAATHGFLPLLNVNEKAVEAQISIGVKSYERVFGKKPKGIWLPECAYYEGLDKLLSKYDIEFFFLDTHGIIYANPAPKRGPYAPILTPNGVYAFGRDIESSKQVWSSKEGYPGDFDYRDFYRDIGYDTDFEYIRPYISPDGIRVFTGIKYYKITGTSNYKVPYEPINAQGKTIMHAQKFHFDREKQIEYARGFLDIKPVVVSPYDAELFGHWWFEGVDFLYFLFKEIDKHKVIKAITPSEYLSENKEQQICKPNPSSWGDRGYFDVWLNGGNDWIYRHLHYMSDKTQQLANRFKNETDVIKIRLLNQLVREMLLAQSSDWAFLMTTNTARDYSEKRTKEHIKNFNKLVDMLENSNIDLDFLQWIEFRDSIFNWLDFRIFADD